MHVILICRASRNAYFCTSPERTFTSVIDEPTPVSSAAMLTLGTDSFRVRLSPRGESQTFFHQRALTRYTADAWAGVAGPVLYIRPVGQPSFWSATPWPTGPGLGGMEVRLHPGGAVFERVEGTLHSRLEVGVSPQDACEIRRLTLSNHGTEDLRVEVTSCYELVLSTPGADESHPAFNKLFVQTQVLSDLQVLTGTRRLRSPEEEPLVVAHALVPDAGTDGSWSYETDRVRFIGRGRTLASPAALVQDGPLSGTVGAVLDPLLAIRREVVIPAGESVALTSTLAAGATEKEALTALFVCLSGKRAEAHLASARFIHPEAQETHVHFPPAAPSGHPALPTALPDVRPEEGLLQDNGYGGFTPDGERYRVRVGGSLPPTPMPWVNVMANERAGCLVSERGALHTWAGNSRENRLSPWYNDPVQDPSGEWFWAYDLETGSRWSLLPGAGALPIEHTVTHGWGYSTFEAHTTTHLQKVTVTVPTEDPVRLVEVRFTNSADYARTFSFHHAVRLVLGGRPEHTQDQLVMDAAPGRILARRPERSAFGQHVTVVGWCGQGIASAHTRLPVHRSLLEDERPGAWLERRVTLGPGETWVGVAVLGEFPSATEAEKAATRWGSETAFAEALTGAQAFWKSRAGTFKVETPEPSLTLMLNGWLTYQNLSCRMMARTAYYQSGGAYGFRDQLQDSGAFLHTEPSRTRAQIIKHAGHQFPEGDVLHWWHPPLPVGIRTRFSDDLLWLPFYVNEYLEASGDLSLLDEPAGFVSSRELEPGEDEVFLQPHYLEATAPVFDHCLLALDRSLTEGAHGLPLMGVGDWNDGMNRVGREGKGESVWLGMFLYEILGRFIPLCTQRGRHDKADLYTAYRERLFEALNRKAAGWDGGWYRRAYYDNGQPLGSTQSDECQIDALAQAWAVLSGTASEGRVEMALDALEKHLVDEQVGIIRLLAPAFDKTPNDPGYIKGYVPGVRENGGQYTHAALWAVRAFAQAGRRDRAAELLCMISPVSHADSPERVAIYQTEPYVIAADVYGVAPHNGRGGWTWYTGSAGWMQRVGMESILGLRVTGGNALRIAPTIPDAWPGFSASLTPEGKGTVQITATTDGGAAHIREAFVDGQPLSVNPDGSVHVPLPPAEQSVQVHLVYSA